ncbi:MAG: ATP-binding protein [Anaerolineae bacterium]|nr:ATP-binding protein [Anaerolineae bacterium]
MTAERTLDNQALLDGLGQSTLVFDSADRLIMINQAARTLLGQDVRAFQVSGWMGANGFFERYLDGENQSLDEIRARALASDRPIRFQIQRNGEVIPCWASAVHRDGGEIYTLLTLEVPDWQAINTVMQRYLDEVDDAIGATIGHATLIEQNLRNADNTDVAKIERRVGGFTRLINVHMVRIQRLTAMITRLNAIRAGEIRDLVTIDRRKIVLADFLEDFVETIDDMPLVDPDTETDSFRPRLKVIAPAHLAVSASPRYLTHVLRDILRNAIMYSMRGTPITMAVFAGSRESTVQFDLTDEGYGIRASEFERVFAPFERSHQPQIISEFGYGLSLHLCKHEIEAMDGLIWFESQEGSGTTFSLRLPAWRSESSSASSSSAT